MLIFRPGNISKMSKLFIYYRFEYLFKGQIFNTTKYLFDPSGAEKEHWVELSLERIGRDFNTAGSCAIELKNRMFIFGGLEPYKHQV